MKKTLFLLVLSTMFLVASANADSVWQCTGDPAGCTFHWTSAANPECDIDYDPPGGGSSCDEWVLVADELNNNNCCGVFDPWGCGDKGNGSCLVANVACDITDWTEAGDDTCDCVLVDSWNTCMP